MCLTIPGIVESIKDGKFIISYGDQKRQAHSSAVDVKVGDYVIMRNNVIVNTLKKEVAIKSLKYLNGI